MFVNINKLLNSVAVKKPFPGEHPEVNLVSWWCLSCSRHHSKVALFFHFVFFLFSLFRIIFTFPSQAQAAGTVVSIFQHLNIRPLRINNEWTWFRGGKKVGWWLRGMAYGPGPGEVNEGLGMEAVKMLQPVNSA